MGKKIVDISSGITRRQCLPIWANTNAKTVANENEMTIILFILNGILKTVFGLAKLNEFWVTDFAWQIH